MHTVLYIFDSKQQAYDNISIHHETLNSRLDSNTKYLDRFIFSTQEQPGYTTDATLNLVDVATLLKEVRDAYIPIQSVAKPLYAENVKQPHLSKEYSGISAFAKAIKGDRSTIREYVNGKKGNTLYRKQWKLTFIFRS